MVLFSHQGRDISRLTQWETVGEIVCLHIFALRFLCELDWETFFSCYSYTCLFFPNSCNSLLYIKCKLLRNCMHQWCVCLCVWIQFSLSMNCTVTKYSGVCRWNVCFAFHGNTNTPSLSKSFPSPLSVALSNYITENRSLKGEYCWHFDYSLPSFFIPDM